MNTNNKSIECHGCGNRAVVELSKADWDRWIICEDCLRGKIETWTWLAPIKWIR